jgi:hypothetical protein
MRWCDVVEHSGFIHRQLDPKPNTLRPDPTTVAWNLRDAYHASFSRFSPKSRIMLCYLVAWIESCRDQDNELMHAVPAFETKLGTVGRICNEIDLSTRV